MAKVTRPNKGGKNPTYIYSLPPSRPNRKKKRNPPIFTPGFWEQSLWGGAGAVISRLVPQWVLAAQNTGLVGYGLNLGTGLGLYWAGGKWINQTAANSLLMGAGIALFLRLAQDFGFGAYAAQAGLGLGDPLAAYFTSAFVDPALFTGNGAERRVPPAWRPPALAPAAATRTVSGLASTYSTSTYR